MIAKNKRILKDGFEYDKIIPKPNFETQKLSNFITVDDTVESIIKIVQRTPKDTEKLAQLLKRDTIDDTCKAIFDFVYAHIQYTKDKTGYEELRRPARGWADRQHGIDCDCYSIFIGSILYNLKIPFAFRVTKYSGDWQHIYPIVYDKNAKNILELDEDNNLVRTDKKKDYIIIDCVVDYYDYEVPYTDKKDTKMATLYLHGFDTEEDSYTTVSQDLGALGKAKKKKKAEKKAARKNKKSKKKAEKKEAKAKKKEAKKDAKANKKEKRKFGGSKDGKKGGLFSKAKNKIKAGKEKRKIKKAAKKEKKAANPKKKGLFAKAKQRKQDKKDKKTAEKQRKDNSTIKINPNQDDFETQEVTTTQNIQNDEFDTSTKNTSTSSKEFMSEDGETYTNTGSWGGDVKKEKKDDEINVDISTLKNQMDSDANKAQEESKSNFEKSVEQITAVTETGLTVQDAKALQKLDAEDEADEKGNPPIPVNEVDEGESEKTGVQKYIQQAITYTKENPLIVGGVAVGVPVGLWGISKLLSSSKKSVHGIEGLDGLDGKKKHKKKSKSKTKKTTKSTPKTHSKAQRKHARANFGGLK